ncbi:TrkH family potassium uptake protein [Aeromicrobium phragmitis]|uniref:TrkH family potassium uptake protein n=2 Tax=Aeromicrobium phragmitis TaxID=2478914 RepID=A0A3L8PIW1_9ACTN|nr:TrkH family potassium uptake protein [Aeromicrobium phragmitis]
MLPVARAGPGGASALDALFTATSALCVTGLVTVDTPVYWSGFGQVVILALIQIGGFGVMTFASVVGLAVVRRLSFRSKLRAATEAKSLGLNDVRSLVLGVVRISLVVEATVAVVLTLRFALGYDIALPRAAWLGIFHAVSAFNNAGFALFSDSLTRYATDAWICLPLCAAIVIGGLGFPVIMQLRRHLRVARLWTMNTRLVLFGTGVLLLGGTVFITLVEWRNPQTLGAMAWHDKLLVGFFHSVQTRTAGFNSVDIGAMDSATWLGMNVLMFIGGGPAGTAGGIKVTTFAVLLFIIVTEIRGETAVNVFGKRLSRSVHRQAIAVSLTAVALVVGSTMVLMLVTEFTLDEVLFEVVSAFATVGLSTGITADLPPVGQLVLVPLMFIGRLGPITFASALALRERRRAYELPKERPIIG